MNINKYNLCYYKLNDSLIYDLFYLILLNKY